MLSAWIGQKEDLKRNTCIEVIRKEWWRCSNDTRHKMKKNKIWRQNHEKKNGYLVSSGMWQCCHLPGHRNSISCRPLRWLGASSRITNPYGRRRILLWRCGDRPQSKRIRGWEDKGESSLMYCSIYLRWKNLTCGRQRAVADPYNVTSD